VIVDYKTAKYTGAQDKLYPMYEAQLNVYALIGEQVGFAPVSGLALIYMEPVTDDTSASQDENHLSDGFLMGFRANIHEVKLDSTLVSPLMSKTRGIYELSSPPAGNPACKDCLLVGDLTELLAP